LDLDGVHEFSFDFVMAISATLAYFQHQKNLIVRFNYSTARHPKKMSIFQFQRLKPLENLIRILQVLKVS